jgi:diguanylate cyclase (GGDEF)-like protein/putative nucleotidyltransferase with HDIG domain
MQATATHPDSPARPPAQDFRALQRPVQAYLAGVTGLGLAILVHAVLHVPTDRLTPFFGLLFASLLTSTVKVPLPLAHGGSTLSLSYIVNFIAILYLGPYAAVPIAVVTAWSQCTFKVRRPNPDYQTLFSMAALGVTAAASGWAYQLALPRMSGFEVGAAIVAATVYFLLNTALVATAVGLSTDQRLPGVWTKNFLWSSPTYFLGAMIATLAVIVARGGGAMWAATLTIPAYLSYRSYKAYSDRISEEQRQVREMSDQQLDVIEALTSAIEAKDGSSPRHKELMQTYAEGLAESIGLSPEEVRAVRTAALLHDVGNLAVPEHILSKPDRLTAAEYDRVKIHSRVGADILKSVRFSHPVSPLILAHHERWDGRGYPLGLKGANIPIGARVLSVVDCFTAMLSDRPYRPARTYAEAIATLREIAGSTLDPDLVDRFIRELPALEAKLQAAQGPSRVTTDPAGPLSHDGALEDIAVAHREERAVHEMAQALSSALNPADVVALVSSRLVSLVPFTSSAVFLCDEESGLYHCKHASGADAGQIGAVTASTLEGLETKLSSISTRRRSGGTPRAQSVVVEPLGLDGRVIGALVFHRSDADVYTADHRRLVTRIASQAAPVIANAVRFEQAHEQSLTDPLTGLSNRRAIERQLAHELSRAGRDADPVTVLLFDLDGFKGINDVFGHQAGDRALQTVAQYLSAGLRDYDTCARYGGDEFVITMGNCDAAQGAQRMQAIQDGLARLAFEPEPGRRAALSISAGAATFPSDGISPETLLAVADSRMYQDKSRRLAGAARGASL